MGKRDQRRKRQRQRRQRRRQRLRSNWWRTGALDERRWALITFGGDPRVRALVRDYMPLLTALRVQVAPSFYGQATAFSVDRYVDWAVRCVDDAIHDGFDVLPSLNDNAADMHRPDYPELAVRFCEGMAQRQVERDEFARGRVVGLCLDAEWENDKYASGPEGYVRSAAAVTRAVRDSEHPLPIVGPGGTHSDDKSLGDVLRGLAAADASPDHASFHAYSDKGSGDWYDDRLRELRDTFRSHGHDVASITECGVTGEEDWGDSDDDGTPLERQARRMAWMKQRLESEDWLGWKVLYQVTEGQAPAGEEHGFGFGLFKPGSGTNSPEHWTPSLATRYWRE